MTLLNDAMEIWQAGVAAVRADRLVKDHVSIEDDILLIGDEAIDVSDFDRVLLVGAGKAAAAMALAIRDSLSHRFPIRGWVNVPEGTYNENENPAGDVRIFSARPAGINEPTEAAIFGTKKIIEMVQSATEQELCLVVLTGGGSALLAAPIDGVSLSDKLAVIRHLSGSGADIEQLNTVRKQLSKVKGGGLINACSGSCVVTIVLSDVLGDPLDVIASGPTVPNLSTPDDALQILKRFDGQHELPLSVYSAIKTKNQPSKSSSISAVRSYVVVLGNNATAVDAAGVKAESLGYSHAMTVAQSCEGSASSVGIHLAEMAVSMLRDCDVGKKTPDCLISGGEPTVQLAPANIRGRGGRNTHLVLAAMQQLIEMKVDVSLRDRIVILSGGTDGEDGPTDAAGAILSAEVWQAMDRLQLDPADYLSRSDSYTFFKQTGGLMLTGPTHTNVCDVRVVAVKRAAGENTLGG